MIKCHELKVLERFFPSLVDMSKPFEIRKNDRGFERGDYCLFHEILQHSDGEVLYTGHTCIRAVSFVLTHKMWEAVPEGFVILGLKEIL